MNVLKKFFTALVLAVILSTSLPAHADWSDNTFSYSVYDSDALTCAVIGAAPNVTLKGDITIPTKVLRPSDGLTYTVVSFDYGARNERFDDPVTDVFAGQNKITSITFPATFTESLRIDEAFSGCTSIKAFYVEKGNTEYIAVDGILYDQFQGKPHTLIKYPAAKTAKKYTFPETVRNCECYAFEDARYLTTVEFTGTLFINDGIFHGNKSITTLTGAPTDYKNVGNTMLVT